MLARQQRMFAEAVVRRLNSGIEDLGLRFTVGGESFGSDEAPARWILDLRDFRSLLALVYDPMLAFGDLYSAGALTVEGPLIELLAEVNRRGHNPGFAHRLLPRFIYERALRNDPASSRDNAKHHYDVGNEFYQHWLDERMVYTCAYFEAPNDSLEDAQVAKMDHVCRKVALRPGERVVEAGCGWGSLALHMARYYGVTVTAYNVSSEQIHYARESAEKQGLLDRVTFVEDDYRNATGEADAFVSVGMLEHVGKSHYRALGAVIDRVLTREGRGLVHSIARPRQMRLNPWIERRVFPNAYAPTLREMMEIFEPNGLSVLDVENLRRHYARTARHWFERYVRSEGQLEQLVDEMTLRTWRLYLAGTAASFEAHSLELFQVVFSRMGNNRIPWSRAYLYTGAPDGFGDGAA